MNKRINVPSIAGVLLLTLLSAALTSAQEQGKQLSVIAVEHADINQVFNVVSDLMQDKSMKMSLDESTNSLIVHAYEVDVAAISELVRMLDKKGARAPNERFAEVLNLKDSSAPAVANVLNQVLVNNKSLPVRIAVDNRTNSLILTGSRRDVDTARELVQQLAVRNEKPVDAVANRNYQVRVTWLVDTSGFEDTEFFDEPNESLGQLAEALKQDGSLVAAKTLTRNQTSIEVGSSPQSASNKFNNTSMRHGSDGPIVLDVKGKVRGMSDGILTLELFLNMSSGNANLSIGTTVTLPLNHPVAFSISDVGKYRSAAVVEVLGSN